MSTGNQGPTYVARHFVVSGEEFRRASGWLFILGILLVILGTIALFAPLFATVGLVVFYGWLLLFSGVAQVIAAIVGRRWGGFFLHLLIGLVDIAIGATFLRDWELGARVVTLLLVVAFLVGGVFRIAMSLSLRFPNWGWTLLSGVITLALAIYLWALYPLDSYTIPGLFLGIQMLFYGWSAVMLGTAGRS
jgi:uncharacterized membrane protein HdeD (DUF308 family)